jgi:hypothetical protein
VPAALSTCKGNQNPPTVWLDRGGVGGLGPSNASLLGVRVRVLVLLPGLVSANWVIGPVETPETVDRMGERYSRSNQPRRA